MTEFPWVATQIPSTWYRCEIQELCTVVRGGSPRPKGNPKYFGGAIPFVKISDVTASDGRTLRKTIDSVNEEGAKKSRLIQSGRLILSNSGTVCVPVFLGFDACIHDGFVAFEDLPDSIDQIFLYHFFKYIRPFILEKHKQGVTQVNLNTSIVSEILLALPPPNEQRRIVEKIEAMFERIDKGVENLRAAKTTLALYRQSLLKSAFEGRLTADWRAQNADKLEDPKTLLARIQKERDTRYKAALDDWQTALTEWRDGGEKGKKPAKPKRPVWPDFDFSDLAKLPDGWFHLPFEALAWSIRNGISAKPDGVGPLKIFRISAVRARAFDLQDFRRITDTDGTMDAFRLSYGDLVFTRYNGSRDYVGVSAMYRGDGTHVYPDKLIRCEIKSDILNPAYLEVATNCGETRAYLEKRIRTTAGQSGISGGDIKGMPVPICSPAEQTEITRILDARLDAADKMEAEIDASLTRADALRQSILKQAFSGKLVPQDPTDEPATTLLARIKAERGQATKTARKGKITA